MSELKFKNITNIKEYEVNGISENPINQVPIHSPATLVANLSTFVQFVKDFNSFIETDLGMIRVIDPNQINPETYDITGSQLQELNTYLSTKSPWHLDGRYKFEEKNYGYNIFALSDELQETHPIYLRFDFTLLNSTASADRAASLGYPKMVPAIKLSIINGKTNKVITKQTLFNGRSSVSNSVSELFFQTFIQEQASFGFYNSSRLFLNIFPQKSFASSYSSPLIKTTNSAYMSFYFERTEKYIQLINFSNVRYTSSTLDSDARKNTLKLNSNFYSYYSYSTDESIIATSDINFIPLSSTNKKISNKPFNAFKTVAFDTQGFMYQSTNVMSCYSDQINSSNSPVIDVKMEDGSIAKYLAYNNNVNIYFIGNNYITTMFRIN